LQHGKRKGGADALSSTSTTSTTSTSGSVSGSVSVSLSTGHARIWVDNGEFYSRDAFELFAHESRL
jgi:hypothetical protein